MNANHLTISFFLTLLLPLASALNSDSLKRGSRNIPAMYVFGDSLFGNGNNKYLGFPSNDASFLPYGMDFAGSKPTGRYTNGKTVADYLAILLGLPFPPAYLSLSKRQRSKITTGITYASGGSGILQETNNKTSLTLPTQLKIFNRTVQNDLPKMFKEQAVLERHLSESLFVISAGVNDYGQIENRILPSTRSFALFLLKELSRHLQELYKFGARKFLVNNIPPAGCFPSIAARMTPRGNCNETMNRVINSYNERLPRMLYQLQSQLPGLIFVHSDLYGFLVEMRTTAHKYGILDTWKPCCPNRVDGDLKCRRNTIPCEDRNTHLYFDDHPSQVTNDIYVRRCFNETTICRPLNLKHFVRA
ncbi:GDSL esterase/lipase At2g03980-like [Prosopis cineraria]|uniref:GDSL esterase/lipase At2g03980-like n=1 Tax=Prosopis cineraria TaxID=364024 RepID=UPI00240F17AE|nr:GDSL esterase/lipase At2g03980-like [Prosopis cineraria]